MATVPAASKRPTFAKDGHPERISLRNISWKTYEDLRADEANWGIRMSYDQGELELMAPGLHHEEFAERFRMFVMALAMGLGIDFKAVGSWTLKNEEHEKAKEPDVAYYVANCHRVRHKEIDLKVDPPPDIAFEAEASRSAIKALSIYEAIGVPEIWRFDGNVLRIHLLQADGHYRESDRSLSFPFLLPGEFAQLMLKADDAESDMAWMIQVQDWVRDEVAPRIAAAD